MTADNHLTRTALHIADTGGPTPGWHHHAACHGADDELFFPPVGGGDSHPRSAQARRICNTCPVQVACLADGITTHRAGLQAGTRAGITNRRIRDLARQADHNTGRPATSTDRLHRVADLTRAGHTAQAIAHMLGISERTAQRWRQRATATTQPGKAA